MPGLYRSKDGGDSWTALPNVGPQMMYDDIHGLAIRPGDPSLVYSTSPFGLAVSTNEGESWDHHKFPSFDPGGSSVLPEHPRAARQPGRNVRGQRDGIPGITGAVRRTVDGGASWDTPELPVTPNSVVYCFSAHVDVPDCIAAASLYGYLYLSGDGGASWRKGSESSARSARWRLVPTSGIEQALPVMTRLGRLAVQPFLWWRRVLKRALWRWPVRDPEEVRSLLNGPVNPLPTKFHKDGTIDLAACTPSSTVPWRPAARSSCSPGARPSFHF